MPVSVSIIGAGVAGLGIAWQLAQQGYAVKVFDQGAVGQGASWAAAGMLAAVLEAEPGEDALLPFVLEAQALWPEYARSLEAYSGLAVGYRETGTLSIAPLRDDVGVLQQRLSFLQQRGLPVRWLDRADLKAREPFLAPRIAHALYSPHDHQVDNRALVQALHQAALKAGVEIFPHHKIDRIILENNRVQGMVVKGEALAAPCVVLAAGAWSGSIAGLPAHALPPVFPMKGQLLALQMEVRQPLLRHVVWTPQVYLVPRCDGRLVVGATMEDKGFDTGLTAGGLLHLLRETWEVLPGIEELPLLESWAGLRPTSRDDAPILGASGVEGLVLATGQHRHGILMTPLLAKTVADYIISGELAAIATPFTMARFSHASHHP